MKQREQWGSRSGFVFAAVGSAIGLGNIWRFPAIAYGNGGGAFFLPYLFALLTAGIPLLILEFTLGHKYRGSSPLTFFRISKKVEWLGWWQAFISFIIASYYSVIVAWALSFAVFSFNTSWGKDPSTFFSKKFAEFGLVSPGSTGHFVPGVLIPLVIVWIAVFLVMFKGAKGIEKANKFFIPALVIMFIMIVIRAVTLDGAAEGLNAFFKPDWSQITKGSVWVAAYGQIFFSLSIAFGIMIAYSSYLPKKSDINNNAFITGFCNSGFELLAGIGVFAALGFMAHATGSSVSQVAEGASGVGLVFWVFPQIINQFPAFQGLFGVLFFLSVVLAGFTSMISITEAYVSSFRDKFDVSRKKVVIIGVGLSAVLSLLYASQGGLYFLDVIDHFINSYGVALSGLVEVILIAWVFRKLGELQSYGNELSDLRTAGWWKVCLGIITPIVLGYMMFDNIKTDVTSPYEGYPGGILFVGVIFAALAIVIGFVLTLKKWDPQTEHNKEAN